MVSSSGLSSACVANGMMMDSLRSRHNAALSAFHMFRVMPWVRQSHTPFAARLLNAVKQSIPGS